MHDDPLVRELTASEKQWLPQSSLICLAARLSESLSDVLTDDILKQEVKRTCTVNPFLQVAIDTSALCYKRNGGITITSETLEGDGVDGIRKAAQRQLELGIDREACLARVHLVHHRPGGGSSHLLLVGDHLCFDGKSLMIWLNDIASARASVEAAATALDFVDWTERIPVNVTFPSPFESPVTSIKLPTKAPQPEELIGSIVEDVVVNVDADVFSRLKVRSKEMGTTLNAPLMVSFFAAMADTALRQGAVGIVADTVDVRSVCAVDLRPQLGLPANYMNNSASVVPVHATFPRADEKVDGSGLWPVAQAAQAVMLENIDHGEAYRLHDITKRGAFAEFGPYFDILCLWSNMGSLSTPGIEFVEVHLRGSGSNPIISAHPITVGSALALTLTFSPAFHDRETVEYAAARFLHHAGLMA